MAREKSGAAIESVGETQVAIRGVIMPAFSPTLITIMRTVLEDAMTKVPAEQATTVTKAYLAEFILKAAAGGLTSYEGLITAAVAQLSCPPLFLRSCDGRDVGHQPLRKARQPSQ
jgi:hypothetical protein